MEKENENHLKKKSAKEKKKSFCTNCGEELSEDDIFCQNCGMKIENKEESSKEEDFNDDIQVENDEEAIENEDIKKAHLDINNNEIDEDNSEERSTKDSKINVNKHKDRKERDSNKKEIFFTKIKNSRALVAIISSIITLVICIIFTIIYCNKVISSNDNTASSNVKKNVTITDTGLASSVSKVYDAVVVVETYVKGQLYATGTGFVYKTDDKYGYILTNNHVIENGTEIKVVFTDNSEKTVKVVGSDSYSDIALLSVDKSAVKAVATIGSSEKMEVGDTTFAVGAPIDSTVYSWTVTRGILSGKNRLVEVSTDDSIYSTGSSDVMEVLQTDAAINSGNSGGPLCNANGEVIGITNMKIASSSVEGMGFAIPIETATSYADKFIKGEKIVRPYLGISMYDMSDTIYGSSATGVYVAAVESGSPADKAGLEKGDVITKIGDTTIKSSSYLKYELYKYSIGDKVKFTYTRNNKEHTTTVTLGSTSSS